LACFKADRSNPRASPADRDRSIMFDNPSRTIRLSSCMLPASNRSKYGRASAVAIDARAKPIRWRNFASPDASRAATSSGTAGGPRS
jgi:hypothetical protein